jgi:NTE family protein
MTRALVLSGGGFAGAAWMVGLIEGLRERNIDLGAADLIVGTSGGARTGAQLASRTLGQAAGIYRRGEAPPATATAPLDRFVTASMGILAEAEGQEAARRIANLEPLGERLGDPAERRAVIAAHLPVQEWPDQRLAIVAVDAETGARVAFEASSGVPLLDAVTASGALPGIYPLVTIDGRRYADGGAHSLYSADLADGHDIVTIVSPIALNPYLRRQLDAEVAELGEATVNVIIADEASLAAIGPDPLAVETMPAAVDAGAAQAQREAIVWDRER